MMKCQADANMLILSRLNTPTSVGGTTEGKIFKVTRRLFCRLYGCRLSRRLRPNLRVTDSDVGFETPLPFRDYDA